jgi:hypothetical protein
VFTALYGLNVYVKCVYCAVRTECLNVICLKFCDQSFPRNRCPGKSPRRLKLLSVATPHVSTQLHPMSVHSYTPCQYTATPMSVHSYTHVSTQLYGRYFDRRSNAISPLHFVPMFRSYAIKFITVTLSRDTVTNSEPIRTHARRYWNSPIKGISRQSCSPLLSHFALLLLL